MGVSSISGGLGGSSSLPGMGAGAGASPQSIGGGLPPGMTGIGQPQQQEAPPKKKGFFGKIFGAAKSVVKGATVGLGKAIVKTVTDPKKLLMAALGVGAIIATGGAATPFVVGAGLAMAGGSVLKNGAAATKAYASGDTEGGEKALEGVGTGLGAGALAVAGAKISAPAGTSTLNAVKGTYSTMRATTMNGVKNFRAAAAENGYGATARSTATRAVDTGKSNLSGFYNNSVKPVFSSKAGPSGAAAGKASQPIGPAFPGVYGPNGLVRPGAAPAVESAAGRVSQQIQDRIAPVTQRLASSKPGQVVGAFNQNYKGAIPALGSNTPFKLSGDLKDNPAGNAAQVDPSALTGLQQ